MTGASVAIRNLDGGQLCNTTTDAEGRFACEVTQGELEQGFVVEVSGGEIDDLPLVGELTSLYGPAEPTDLANVTFVTTLISELADLEDGGTPIEKRDTVIQSLSDIGLFLADEWSSGEPVDVAVVALRTDMARDGIAPVLDGLVEDLTDGELEADSMAYFPAAHGGIRYLSLSATDNILSGFPGGVVLGRVILIGSDDNPNYDFTVTDGPSGIEIDVDGNLAYSLPDSAAGDTNIDFSIEVANSLTGKGRTLNGSFFVMSSDVFDLGSVGPGGGTLREPVNSVEIVVPEGSLEAEVGFSFLRGRDAEGNWTLEVRATGDVGSIDLYLPDPRRVDTATETAADATHIADEKAIAIAAAEESSVAHYPSDLWREEWDWFWNGAKRIGRQFTVIEPIFNWATGENFVLAQARAEVASALYCPESLSAVQPAQDGSAPSERRIPVLFIHGYATVGLDGEFDLGGGKGTWGDFPPRVAEIAAKPEAGTFFPCEFRWKSNARFQDVAEDLRKAVNHVTQKTGRQVHIVAHSFGGILARTYLQGLAEAPVEDYAKPVASLTTLGTPHSGIANRESEDMHGVIFPDGRDDWKIDFGGQISAYQMGVSGVNAPAGTAIKEALRLQEEEGFIAAAISATSDDNAILGFNPFPENFPVQVLIGLNTDQACTPGIGCTYFAEEGDGLITYAGQRFHPDFSTGATRETLLTAAATNEGPHSRLRAEVTEHILGTEEDIQPGALEDKLNPFYGFSHTAKSGARKGRLREVELECVTAWEGDKNTGCDFHDGFRLVRLWLTEMPSEEVSPKFSDLGDSSTTGIAIAGSAVDASNGIADMRISTTVVTQNGAPLERLGVGNFSLTETTNGVSRDGVINSVGLEGTAGTAVVIVIDRSGSMGPSYNNDIEAAKAAAKTFVNGMEAGDQAAIIDFAGDVVVRQGFTRDKELLVSSIDSVQVGAFNGTAAYDAAYEGLALTEEVFGRKAVLLLTDGADLSSTRSIAEVSDYAQSLGVPIYTIGLGVESSSPEEEALIRIANESNAGSDGSGYYAAPTAAELEKLYRDISDLLSNAYVVSWQSSGISGDVVTVEISVEYTAALGTFRDTFVVDYTVP